MFSRHSTRTMQPTSGAGLDVRPSVIVPTKQKSRNQLLFRSIFSELDGNRADEVSMLQKSTLQYFFQWVFKTQLSS